jgi:hypothetical protein
LSVNRCFFKIVSAAKIRQFFKSFCDILSYPGLPDGFFSNQKYHFGLILEGLRLENVEICYGHRE